MTRKTAIIQVRVSSQKQAEKELPIDSQIERCKDKARALNADVLRVFVEDGQSAFYKNRPEFEEAIEYCEKSFPDYFITWSTSRFSRTQSFSVQCRHRLECAGVEIVYASFDAGSDPDTRFLNIGLRELMDEYYSRQTSKDTMRSMIRNAREGFYNGGGVPFGYATVEVGKKKKKLAVNEDERHIVEEIFNMRYEGLGARAIAKILNDQKKTNRGKTWKKCSITSLLRNKTVNGYIVFNKKDKKTGRPKPEDEWVVVKSHEAIIDDDIFIRVQTMMDEAAPSKPSCGSAHSSHLFTGLIRCDGCGKTMMIETGKSGKYSYYNCGGYLKNGTCEDRRVTASELDNFLINKVTERIFSPENMQEVFNELNNQSANWTALQQEKIDKLNSKIYTLETRNKKLMDLILQSDQQGVDSILLVRNMNDNEQEIVKIRSNIDRLENEEPMHISLTNEEAHQMAVFLFDVIKEANNVNKIRNFLQIVLKEVILKPDKAIIYFRPDMLTAKKLKFPSEVVWLPETGSNCRPSD